MRWLETLVGALMKRVVFSALLAVVLVACGILLDATYGLGWGMAMALQSLVATFAADKGIVDQAAAKMAVVEVAGD